MPAIPTFPPSAPSSLRLRDTIINGATQALSDISSHLSTRIPKTSTLLRRQLLAIPTQYAGLNSGPSPGVVVGIVLGSIIGFLLLIGLLWVASSGSGFIRSTTLQEEDIIVRRRSRSRGTTRRSHTRPDVSSRSPRRERVIRQERIVRDIPPPMRDSSRMRETIVVEGSRPPPMESRVPGDDIIEVFEEHSSVGVPPPKRKSRRSSGYR